MIMLKEHRTPQERQEAYELSQNNPDLLFIHAALCPPIDGNDDVKLFAYPFNAPTYWFLLHIQKNTTPFVIIAQDGDSYDRNTFMTGLKLFSEKTRILKTEKHVEFGAEAHLMHEISRFVSHAGHRSGTRREHHVFYMTPDQMERVEKVECTLPYGFEESNLTVEDAEEIVLQSESKQPVDLIRKRIEYLPSACIRQSSSGRIVSRELRSFSGAMVDQYTVPEYRRQGLGQAVEIILSQKIISLDETPFKLVPTFLTSILLSSQESPFWAMWSRNTFPVPYVLQAFRKTL